MLGLQQHKAMRVAGKLTDKESVMESSTGSRRENQKWRTKLEMLLLQQICLKFFHLQSVSLKNSFDEYNRKRFSLISQILLGLRIKSKLTDKGPL